MTATTTELATRDRAGDGGAIQAVTYSREQIDLIKRTICVDATDDELSLFLARAAKTGLDPFLRQIYSIKRGGKHTIQVGIDGLRLVAIRSGEADGQEGPHWCGPDGIWRDTWLDKAPPAACKVVAFRRRQSRGYTGVAHLGEYFQSSNGLWKSMPANMLAKCAEALALRKAFPQELSGLYADAEMDQADAPPRQSAPIAVKPPKEAFIALLSAKGWTWGRALRAIDKQMGTDHVALQTNYEKLPASFAAEFAERLRTLPDAPPPQTPAAETEPASDAGEDHPDAH